MTHRDPTHPKVMTFLASRIFLVVVTSLATWSACRIAWHGIKMGTDQLLGVAAVSTEARVEREELVSRKMAELAAIGSEILVSEGHMRDLREDAAFRGENWGHQNELRDTNYATIKLIRQRNAIKAELNEIR